MDDFRFLSVGTPNSASVQKVTSSGTSARNSTALIKHTPYLIVASADCNFKLGGSAITASSSDMFLPAKQYLVINNGDNDYIAVIAASVDLYIAELIKQPEFKPAVGQYGG